MWKQEYANCICTAEQLCSALGVSSENESLYEKIIKLFPMRITPYYFSLIDQNNPDDPIARLCIPSEDELSTDGQLDTSGELSNTKQEGVQHKYTQTALILSSNTCAMYCRYCFRKRMVGLSDSELNKQVDEAADYVRKHPEITNVLVTGGDSLMNPNHIIRRYLEELSAVDTVDFIRFGSRVPVTFPSRIYDDQELLEIMKEYSEKKPIYLITQFNHPREITPESIRAVRCFQDMGIQVRNQTVLLKGVNDNPEVLGILLRELTRNEIVPYYIFQCRPVTGVKGRYQVPLLKAVKIVDAAKNMQSGIGKCVRYCMSHPRGKIEILGTIGESTEMLFKFHQSKYLDDASRIFSVKLGDSSTWLDEELNAE